MQNNNLCCSLFFQPELIFSPFLNLLYFVHNSLSELPQLAVQSDGCGVQYWVFTVGGQFQIIVSPGAVANQFLFPQSQATSWRFGTTAHLGLVRAKDTRSTELGSEEKRGAPPLSAAPASQPEPGGFWCGRQLSHTGQSWQCWALTWCRL